MIKHTDSPTPASEANAAPGMANSLFRIEMPDSYDEPVSWLQLAEPANVPSSAQIVRVTDELALIPEIFDGTAHKRFGFHPLCELTLFVENEDTSWSIVAVCAAPIPESTAGDDAEPVEQDADADADLYPDA